MPLRNKQTFEQTHIYILLIFTGFQTPGYSLRTHGPHSKQGQNIAAAVTLTLSLTTAKYAWRRVETSLPF